MRYELNDREVSREEAFEFWLNSKVYKSLPSSVKDSIWLNAHRDNGGLKNEIQLLIDSGIKFINERKPPKMGVPPKRTAFTKRRFND